MIATNPAHSGATALVPPMTRVSPSTRTLYPVFGSASPETSGTPRPPVWPDGGVMPSALCQDGSGNTSLNPPPPAPPLGRSSQTTSLTIFPFEACSEVPPQPKANELDAGKSTWFLPSLTPSEEPLSPEATQTVTPTAAAASKASLKLVMACAVHSDSADPQLIEMTDG